MKKLLCLLFALTFSTALFACDRTDIPPNDPPSVEQPAPEETPPLPDAENPSVPETPSKPSSPQKPDADDTVTIVKKDDYVLCVGSGVNLRSSPSTSANILGSAAKNTRYSLIEKKGNWYALYYKNQIAYLHADYAETFSVEKSQNEKIERVIEVGYKLIGTKYVYGATRLHNGNGKLLSGFSVTAFDCSSLMQYMFYHGANVNLGVTTRAQVVQGKSVKRSALQRGDCIYFTNSYRQNNTGVERIGHVGIYLGNDYMLHTSSDYARIVKMSDTYWWKYYVEARRFI